MSDVPPPPVEVNGHRKPDAVTGIIDTLTPAQNEEMRKLYAVAMQAESDAQHARILADLAAEAYVELTSKLQEAYNLPPQFTVDFATGEVRASDG